MTARHDRDVPRPARSALGRCYACDNPAHLTELGWCHIGAVDEVECRAVNPSATIVFVPDRTPGMLLALALTLAVCTGAAAVMVYGCGAPMPWAVVFAAVIASVVYPGVRAGQSLRITHYRKNLL